MVRMTILLGILAPVMAWSMPIKVQTLKARAGYQSAENNVLVPLDLKAKTLHFTKAEIDECGTKMVRQAQTMTFSCTLAIPTRKPYTKLQSLVTPKTYDVVFGSTKRKVSVTVPDDAREITFTTVFDTTGIDFEISKFNDDFFAVYAKSAHLIITEALLQNPVRLEVLESR